MKKITVKVIPNSSVEQVVEAKPPFEPASLTVKVKEPPTKGKANKAVVKLLSKHFNAGVRIVSGAKSRKKIVEVEK
ncbi:hypothetical protein B6V00_04310 [ANME-1 cluster archaeon ex4572_4]|nr:DUF167 domain-containing protein [Methanophagales archaeon]OYT65639.1 MAG: hypothetical protein B6V00_04310 [ANME-1 cluster archaeon ex4572_4]PXF50442.1 MAG: hypothetical protein C4B55_06320 [Methanophagales archaeon]